MENFQFLSDPLVANLRLWFAPIKKVLACTNSESFFAPMESQSRVGSLHRPLEFFGQLQSLISGYGEIQGLRMFRKTHLENNLPRGSHGRDPRYPKGGPKGSVLLKNFIRESYQGIYSQVQGLLWQKSDFAHSLVKNHLPWIPREMGRALGCGFKGPKELGGP